MAKKIKILYTIPNFDTAGSGKVVYDLVKGLDRDKFEIEIACSNNKGAFFKNVEALGIPIHLQKTTIEYLPYISLFFRLKPIVKFFKSQKYDIVHSWHWSSDWTEAIAARLAGTKWIYTKKAMSWGNRHWKIRSKWANFIITINDEMSAYFPNKKNQKLIPLGIDTDFYNRELFSRASHNVNVFKIITVANLVPVKGIEILINAVNMLDDPSIELIVLGDNENEYGRELETLCRERNLLPQVQFMGKKSDVRPYIAAADLFVIPTLNEGRKEGMPVALVEAMCMGIPVLGSNISGIKFVLKDFKNLLFEAGNYQSLSQKIGFVRNLTAAEREELGMNMRRYVLNNFGYKKFIEAHEQLYIKLIDGS